MGAEAGQRMHALAARLYPICRSITGDGVRESLSILQEQIPVRITEVPTGREVFDWVVPPEWNITEAWIKDPYGNTVVDFKNHNLHVVNYSVSVHRKMSLQELQNHIFTLPDHPDWIPYRTSYYQPNWGFCVRHSEFEKWVEGPYEVCIQSSHTQGSLTYGEVYLPGQTEDEILFSTHICHPSLANDNLSGIGLMAELCQRMQAMEQRHYSYRFVFVPGTIGSICWLADHQEHLQKIVGGLVVSLVGNESPFHYKQTKVGNSLIDRTVRRVLAGRPHVLLDFSPYGYDERQYNSPGIDLQMGNLTRSTFGSYPEYHTSADDLSLITPEALSGSLALYEDIVQDLESNTRYLNLQPYGEPQLGKRGLYQAIGGDSDKSDIQLAMLWILSLSDRQHGLIDIQEQSGLDMTLIQRALQLLLEHDLIVPIAP